ncbi:MAG: FliM/FliN family flagellar motor switch protein [Bacteroidota bacterium]
MSRLLTPEEIAALRVNPGFVPAPRERYHVVIDAGHADLTQEELDALVAGNVIPLTRGAASPVEIVANGTTVAYGDLITLDGRAAVRVIALAGAGTDRRTSR